MCLARLKEKLSHYKGVILVVSFVLVGYGVWHFYDKGVQTSSPAEFIQDVTIAVIKPKDTPIIFNFSAQTEGSKEVEIRSQVTGILKSQLFEDGKLVQAGDVLFMIEPKHFEIAVQSAASQLLKADAELVQASKDEARLRSLIDRKAISQKEYDDAYAKLQMAKANKISETNKLEEAQLKLSYTTIKAPISGAVSKALKNEGSLINSSETLLTKITQIDPIYANFSMAENDFIKLNQNIEKGLIKLPEDKLKAELIYGDRIKYKEDGFVSFSDTEIKKGTGVIQVRTTFPNPDYTLIPGQFVKLRMQGSYRPNAIIIPKRALLDRISGKAVFVVNEYDKAIETEVLVGDNMRDSVQVISGLKAGDKIVVDGAQKIQNNAHIKAFGVVEPAADEESHLYFPSSDLKSPFEEAKVNTQHNFSRG